jgi:hypothetical protein
VRTAVAAAALATTLLLTGCAVPLIGRADTGPTPDGARAELLDRPDAGTATARLEAMLDDVEAALAEDAGIGGWQVDDGGSRRGCADLPGLGGESRTTTARLLRTGVPDRLRDTVVATVERVTDRYGFTGTRTLAAEPGRHTLFRYGPFGATFRFGWEANASMHATTGCHPTAATPR